MTTHKKGGKYKFFAAVAIILLILGLRAITSKADYYSTKIKSGQTEDDEWVLTGKTSAPDNYYVVSINKDDSDDPMQLISDSDGNAVRVHKGEFSGKISAIDALDGEDQVEGGTAEVYIAAVNPKILSDEEKENLDTEIKTNRVNKVKNDGTLHSLSVTKEQEDYINSLDDDTDTDDTDTDDTDTDDTDTDDTDTDYTDTDDSDDTPVKKYTNLSLSTFDRYFKKYLYKGVAMEGMISSLQHDEDNDQYLISIVDSNYDHEFVASISDDDLDSLSYSLEEDDWVDVKGVGFDGFTSTNASGAVKKVPGILINSIKLTP